MCRVRVVSDGQQQHFRFSGAANLPFVVDTLYSLRLWRGPLLFHSRRFARRCGCIVLQSISLGLRRATAFQY